MTRATMDPAAPYLRIPLEPHQLVDRVTRAEDAIVLCHLGVPRLDRDRWSLVIDGLVGRPTRITFAELARRPRVEVTSIHQCCGSPLEPDRPTRRIVNVTWTGVRLADLLAECQPEAAARFVHAAGADHGEFAGVSCDAFVKDLPVERVVADVLLAYEMNGAPLRPENGYPVRLVVPGFYGTNSVKWLTRMTLAAARATGPFTTRWYNDAVRDSSGRPTGATTPVWSIAPESVIVAPAPGAALAAAQAVEVRGWAWADGGADAVDVSADGGSTWMRAALEPPAGRAWQRFSATWRPERRGDHILCSRARSAGRGGGGGRGEEGGSSQPSAGARNSIHRVAIHIV